MLISNRIPSLGLTTRRVTFDKNQNSIQKFQVAKSYVRKNSTSGKLEKNVKSNKLYYFSQSDFLCVILNLYLMNV